MVRIAKAHRSRIRSVSGGLVVCLLCGCGAKRVDSIRLANDTLGPMTIAVAPALNVSGSSDFDPNRVADLMSVELGAVEGIEVIPVNRVLAVLSDQKRPRVESPEHAIEIARVLGADAVLVFAITEYDAYDPPIVGISAQLYGQRRSHRVAAFDPVDESRRAAPSRVSGVESSLAPLAQAERVYDASHEWVSEEVRRFAEARGADASPFGWRKYLASQLHYIRFCCYATVRALIQPDGYKEVPGES